MIGPKSTHGGRMADNQKPSGPAFGLFPQMKPRRAGRSEVDPNVAIPRGLARGALSGVLGAPGDLESFARLPYELITGKESPTYLPTSEDIEKRLPFRGDSPMEKAFTGAGQLTGGLYMGPGAPIRLVGGLPKAVYRAGKDFVQAAGKPAVNVIKPKGGNWLGGSVEGALKGLKRQTANRNDPAEMLRRMRERYTPEEIAKLQEGTMKQHVLNSIADLEKDVALNNWVDRNLGNYVKKEMATPEDPVRRLAEEGIVHIPSEQVGVNRYRAPKHREAYGGEQLGKSEAARAWEDASDVAINAPTARTIRANESLYQANPWTEKLSPEDRVYALNRPASTQHEISGLGFDHILDVLSQDVASGRIRPEQLNKVSMEQAVRRTYEYDQEMAKKMREAQFKATEGMPVHKDYADKGYKWIELAQPKNMKLPEGYSVKPDPITNRKTGVVDTNSYRLVDPEGKLVGWGKTEDEAVSSGLGEKVLADALKYEGDTMGHCVGGYCPDVLEGRSRIYSLRDAKGEPHVTVEVEPNQHLDYNKWYSEQPTSYKALLNAKKSEPGYDPYQEPAYLAARDAMPPKIVQIKGKGNAKPKDDYLPYVQDFVKGGQWSDVGDLGNTGLYKANPEELGMFIPSDPRLKNLPGRRTEDFQRAKEAGLFGDQKYLTRDEWEDILRKQVESESGPLPPLPEEGMAHGGRVHISDNPDTMRMELEDRKMQAGGLVKGLKAAAKAVKGADEPAQMIDQGMDQILVKAADRAAAGRKAAEMIKSQPQVKASEALGQAMEKGMKRTTTTQADRTRVGGGNIGGPSFSALSLADPAYAGRVWGVMDEGTASRLTNLTTPDTVWTTMLGSSDQLKTNPIVFDKLKRGFFEAIKEGKLSPELEAKINKNLALTFGEGAQIRDPSIWKNADTFEKRAALADLMMGQGIPPGKGGVSLGGEKSGKGVIFRPSDILIKETERGLLHPEHGGDVPTFAAGPRLFTMGKESEYRPDLHPGFPTLITGKDLNVNMIPTPTETYLPDWHRRFKASNPDRKGPGYYDLALGVKGEGLPSQDLNDQFIRHLIREGYKKGGAVKKAAGGSISADDLILEERKL